MCLGGGSGPGGGSSAAAAASGGLSGFGGSGIAGPGGGTGRGGMGETSISAAQAASPGQESFGQGGGGWGSSDVGQLASLALMGLSFAVPGLAPFGLVADTLGILPDMEISRSIPAQTPEEAMSQRGNAGQPAALPSISTPAPTQPAPVDAAQPTVDTAAFNKDLMDQYMSTMLSAPSGGGRGIRGAGRPGYKAQQKQTADDWLAKYWRE